ncbi:conserved hypothetical protein [Candidatus Terasakiella magnetica]|nr:conserved hypothetical protein [Candidatus Terasakiella magnetica]
MTNSVPSLQSVLQSIIQVRENWTANEYKASTTMLYSILDQCYVVYVDHKNTADGRKLINEAAKAMNVSFNKVTSTAAKVIKITFGDDHRWQASAYAQVLQIAAGNDVPSANFVNWLTTAGGIEAVRSGGSGGKQSAEDRDAAYNVGLAKLQSVGTAASVAPHVNIQGRGGYVMAICYVDANGGLSVIQTVGVPDSPQVKAEIRRIGNDKAKSATTAAVVSVPTTPVINLAAATAKAQADAIAVAIAAGSIVEASTTQQQIAA